MQTMKVQIETSWKKALSDYLDSDEFKQTAEFARSEYLSKTVFPHPKDVFRAFELCPFDETRVVILGQDPYHTPGQAMGLAFSVPDGHRLQPSLQNIFKEVAADLGRPASPAAQGTGDLSVWARQGVLLLNAVLTVEKGKAASHAGRGWESFTDEVIRTLSERKEGLVFILWGNYAKGKGASIDRDKHLVIESPHPSPFSADRGFFGSRPFSAANDYLSEHGQKPIDW